MASDAAPRKEDAPVGSGGNNTGGAASDTGNKASSDNGDNLSAEAAAGGGDNAGGAARASDTGNKAASDNGDNLDAEAAATGNGELPFDFPPPTVDVAPDAGAQPAGFPLAPMNPIDDETISIAEMGQPNGLTLSGGQLQSGIIFTLAQNQVVTNAHLSLALKVSPALAARDTRLRLMLNGQDLGDIRLNQTASGNNVYRLDVPSAMVVGKNNLSFSVSDDNTLTCERDLTDKYWVTLLPDTHMQLSSQILDTDRDLSHFPRPFFDPQSMKGSSLAFLFSRTLKPDAVEAASMLASYFGLHSSYRSVDFAVLLDALPAQNGILFGEPGDKIGTLTLPQVTGPTLQVINNPQNPVYKLLLVVGRNGAELRQAAWQLISTPLPAKQDVIQVQEQAIPERQPYDAPRWIDTSRPVYLKELTQDIQSLTASGLYHDGIRIGFRAAPDLFMWDGDHIPVYVGYRFPADSGIDEDHSKLDVTLNGTFLYSLPVNKRGLLEGLWRKLGGDSRQERYTLQLAPYLIYGDNQMQFYFSLRPKPNAPCSLLTSNTIKSRIDPDSYIDLSRTYHFGLLPNLSYYVGASFPFTRMADFSQTVMLLPAKPQAAEIATLMAMAARAGNATGITLNRVTVRFGLPTGAGEAELLAGKDILAVASLKQAAFVQPLAAKSRFTLRNGLLSVREQRLTDRLNNYLNGHMFSHDREADRYLASTDAWRGFVSFESPWTAKRVVVLVTATNVDQLVRLNHDLQSAAINAGIRGDVAVINNENGVRSFSVGALFPRGEMPWYMRVLWYANQHIILLALCGLLCALLVGSGVYLLLARHAAKRLANSANPHQDQ